MLVYRPIIATSQEDGPLGQFEPVTYHYDRGIIGYSIGALQNMLDAVAPFYVSDAIRDAITYAGLDGDDRVAQALLRVDSRYFSGDHLNTEPLTIDEANRAEIVMIRWREERWHAWYDEQSELSKMEMD